jgi:hypothetical protein
MSLDVGVLFPTVDSRTYEFWMEMTLQREPDDGEDSLFYLRVIKAHWLERTRHESPYVAQALESAGDDFSARMKYGFNRIRIWYVPSASLAAGFARPLAEEPIPKDKWYSPSDLMALSVPPLPDQDIGNLPSRLFGPGARVQDRYVDPEVQGGKIALLAVKQNGVQKPPNFLDRLQSTFLKQVAYNQRIIAAENEISGINCDVADFVSEMTLDPAEELIICVNGSEEMKRNETAMAGQLWIQGDRKMAAANPPFEGMANTKEPLSSQQLPKQFLGRMKHWNPKNPHEKANGWLSTRRI